MKRKAKRIFQHKIGICKKETKETKHWLRLLAKANPQFKEEFRKTMGGSAGTIINIFLKYCLLAEI